MLYKVLTIFLNFVLVLYILKLLSLTYKYCFSATTCCSSSAQWTLAAPLCFSSHEEITHSQGKRKPSKTVDTERGHQRADRLKLQSQTTSQSDHMEHSLV